MEPERAVITLIAYRLGRVRSSPQLAGRICMLFRAELTAGRAAVTVIRLLPSKPGILPVFTQAGKPVIAKDMAAFVS
jgi:hypothetical protein